MNALNLFFRTLQSKEAHLLSLESQPSNWEVLGERSESGEEIFDNLRVGISILENKLEELLTEDPFARRIVKTAIRQLELSVPRPSPHALVLSIANQPTAKRLAFWDHCVALSLVDDQQDPDSAERDVTLRDWLSTHTPLTNDNLEYSPEIPSSQPQDIPQAQAATVPVILQDPRIDRIIETLQRDVARLSGKVEGSSEGTRFQYENIRRHSEDISAMLNRLLTIEEKFAAIDSSRREFENFAKKATNSIRQERAPLRDLLDWQKSISDDLTTIKLDLSPDAVRRREAHIDRIDQQLNESSLQIRSIGVELHEFLAQQTLREGSRSIASIRFLPASIYVSDEKSSTPEAVSKAFRGFLDSFGLEVSDELESSIGSWFSRILVRTLEKMTVEDLERLANKMNHAIDLHLVEKFQANVNKEHATAVRDLLEATKDSDDAVMKIGSILLVKTNGSVAARVLTTDEQMILAKKPSLLSDPKGIWDALSMTPQRLSNDSDSGSESNVRKLGKDQEPQ